MNEDAIVETDANSGKGSARKRLLLLLAITAAAAGCNFTEPSDDSEKIGREAAAPPPGWRSVQLNSLKMLVPPGCEHSRT